MRVNCEDVGMSRPFVELPPDEAAQVRERLADRGIPGIIDLHTHFMPPQVMRKVWAYFDQAGPLTGRAWPIAYLPRGGGGPARDPMVVRGPALHLSVLPAQAGDGAVAQRVDRGVR